MFNAADKTEVQKQKKLCAGTCTLSKLKFLFAYHHAVASLLVINNNKQKIIKQKQQRDNDIL